MKSTHECEQTVDKKGILSSAVCTERHLFRPFSREQSGALTKISQTLKYMTTSRRHFDVEREYLVYVLYHLALAHLVSRHNLKVIIQRV